jgi:hypothetical protein
MPAIDNADMFPIITGAARNRPALPDSDTPRLHHPRPGPGRTLTAGGTAEEGRSMSLQGSALLISVNTSAACRAML